jgi:hypothetical protein
MSVIETDIPEQPLYPKHDTCPDCGCTKRRGQDCRTKTCPSNQPSALERLEAMAELVATRGSGRISDEKAAALAKHMWLDRDGNKERVYEVKVGRYWLYLRHDLFFGAGFVWVETVNQRTKRQLQSAVDEMERQEKARLARKPATKPQQPAGELEYVALPHVA